MWKAGGVLAISAALLVIAAASGFSAGQAGRLQEVGRVAGSNRFETANLTAKQGWPNGADVVYLVAADAGPDALTARNLEDGPVLYVPRCGPVPISVLETLGQLRPSATTIVGGGVVVSDSVQEQVSAGVSELGASCERTATEADLDSLKIDIRGYATPEGPVVQATVVNGSEEEANYGRGYVVVDEGSGEQVPQSDVSDDLLITEAGKVGATERLSPYAASDENRGESMYLSSGTYRVEKDVNGTPVQGRFEVRPDGSVQQL